MNIAEGYFEQNLCYVGHNDSPFRVAARIFGLKTVKLWAYQNPDAMQVQNFSSPFTSPNNFVFRFRILLLQKVRMAVLVFQISKK